MAEWYRSGSMHMSRHGGLLIEVRRFKSFFLHYFTADELKKQGSLMSLISSYFAVQVRRLHPIVPWCNGSTSDFGSLCIGSNPVGTTIFLFFFKHGS